MVIARDKAALGCLDQSVVDLHLGQKNINGCGEEYGCHGNAD